MLNATEMKFLRGILSRCFIIMPITLIQHDNATSNTARGTVNLLRVNNIEFINDWPAKSPNINPIEHLCDDLDQRVRGRAFPQSYFIQLRQNLGVEQHSTN
jgi:hypothetical protein